MLHDDMVSDCMEPRLDSCGLNGSADRVRLEREKSQSTDGASPEIVFHEHVILRQLP